MLSVACKGLRRWLAVASASVVLAAGSGGLPRAAAQEKDDLRELRERIERLEKQNETLMRSLKEYQPTLKDQAGAVAKPASDPKEIQKIVEDYVKHREERKKAADKKAADGPKEYVVGEDLGMEVRWNHGLWAETADKAYRVHVGGRVQYDTIFYDAPDNVMFGLNGTGPVDDAMAFRRARLMVEGTVYEVFGFTAEFDFVNTDVVQNAADNAFTQNTPVPTDLWGQFMHLPLNGTIRIGNQKPGISFEHLTSSRFLTFLERSYAFDAFIGGLDNGFRPGISFFNYFADERATFNVGVYKNNTTIFGFNTGDGEYDITSRVTALPFFSDGGRYLLHVGLGYSHRDLDEGVARFRARTELRNGPATLHTVLLDTRLQGDSQDLLVPELVVVAGPLSLQAEYYANWLHDARDINSTLDRGTVYYQSAYVTLGYFLTGEHRVYDRRYPRFDRVVPHENFFLVPGDCGRLFGRGAWQLAARYSWIDLDENGAGGVRRGQAHGVTAGINWFLNPNAKIQGNYTWEHRDVVGGISDGDLNGFGMRLAFDF